MKTKNLILIGTILVIGTASLYFWLERKKKRIDIKPEPKLTYMDNVEQPGWKPKTPEALLKKLILDILEGDEWKNERDFLSTLTKLYIKRAPEIGWVDYLPMNQEDLLEKMNELGCLGGYEIELEARYKKK